MRGFCKGCSGCRVVVLRQTGGPPRTTRTTKTIGDHSAPVTDWTLYGHKTYPDNRRRPRTMSIRTAKAADNRWYPQTTTTTVRESVGLGSPVPRRVSSTSRFTSITAADYRSRLLSSQGIDRRRCSAALQRPACSAACVLRTRCPPDSRA